jgi:hypothetical protein
MDGPVLLLDDDADLRFALSEFVAMLCGRQCLTFGS